jgi:NADH-quinone oxidoreductase subunit H
MLIMLSFLSFKLLICVIVFALSFGVGAYTTWLERKFSAILQDRVGPNTAGPYGLLQVLADGIKLFMKEEIIPNVSNKFLFILGPCLAITAALITGVVIPWSKDYVTDGQVFSFQIADINIAILYVFGVVSVGVYGIMIGGWASNNKYALIGAIRASSQMISYEIAMGLSMMAIVMMNGSLSLRTIVEAQDAGVCNFVLQPLSFIIFFICAMAETNRAPFDLPECETELVGGYHTEYSSMKLGFYLFAEYINMFISSAIMAAVYFGGYNFPFAKEFYAMIGLQPGSGWISLIGFSVFFIKIVIFIITFIWIRWTLPRFRYDQLMDLGWKKLIPLSILNLVITAIVLGWKDLVALFN